MSPEILLIPAVIIAGLAGYFVRKLQIAAKVNSAEIRAQRLIEDAQAREKEIILEAKAKALSITEAAKKEEVEFRQQILRAQSRLDRREGEFDQKLDRLEKEKQTLEKKNADIEALRQEIENVKQAQVAKLEQVAGLTTEEAKKILLESTEQKLREELTGLSRKLVLQARDEADRKARDLITQAMERVAADVTAEMTTTTVTLPSEEMKGRIIGKEGRNIKAFEQLIGVEIIVDDTPDTV